MRCRAALWDEPILGARSGAAYRPEVRVSVGREEGRSGCLMSYIKACCRLMGALMPSA